MVNPPQAPRLGPFPFGPPPGGSSNKPLILGPNGMPIQAQHGNSNPQYQQLAAERASSPTASEQGYDEEVEDVEEEDVDHHDHDDGEEQGLAYEMTGQSLL